MVRELVTRDAAIARIAVEQHGIVTHRQLAEAGLSSSAISKRVRAGRLHRVHRGVYAVGHASIGREGTWTAAVLACGERAALSHASAAALWGFLEPLDGPVDVSVPTAGGRARREGVRVHRCVSLGPKHLTSRRGIPVTTVARTLDDLRGAVTPKLVRRARRQAELAGWRVAAAGDGTRSDVEEDFLLLCRRNGLRRPEVNVRIGRWTADFLWRAERVVVETDAWGTHRGSVAFEDDHARDLELRSRGYAVRRYTEAQVRDDPAAVVADLRAALDFAAGPRVDDAAAGALPRR